MLAVDVIPTLPALMPAGPAAVAFGLVLLAVAAGFGALVAALVRAEGGLPAAVRPTPRAPLPASSPLCPAG